MRITIPRAKEGEGGRENVLIWRDIFSLDREREKERERSTTRLKRTCLTHECMYIFIHAFIVFDLSIAVTLNNRDMKRIFFSLLSVFHANAFFFNSISSFA